MSTKHTPEILCVQRGCYTIRRDGTIISRSGWRGEVEKVLTYTEDKSGYSEVRLVIKGRRVKWKVHKLIAEAYKLPKLPGDNQIRHLNGDKKDNRVENLAWGTAKGNALDRDKHGTTSKGLKHAAYIKAGQANARLIAAAPELLVAAKAAWSVLEILGISKGLNANESAVQASLLDAISKAEGK